MTDSIPLKFLLHTSDNDEPWVINQKLFNILTTYLQSATSLSATDVAKDIDKLFPLKRETEENKDNEQPESFLFEMWGVIIDIAEQIPWNHPSQTKLIDVLQALKTIPESMTVQAEGWGNLELWSDLPLLEPVLTERRHAIDLEDISDAQQAIRTRFQNFTAFSAHLTKSGLADRSKYFSIQDFRAAFEEEPDQRSRAYLKQGPSLDLYATLAAIWILHCGNVIFSHCGNPALALAGSQVGGRNWKGPGGFSIERWNFWKKKFGEIKVHNQASDVTKNMATEAEMAMNRIEKEAS